MGFKVGKIDPPIEENSGYGNITKLVIFHRADQTSTIQSTSGLKATLLWSLIPVHFFQK